MARPTTIRDEDLLRAARDIFLAHGIAATTAAIAERAGVSEGILFHRFGSKAKLFQASMTPPDIEPLLASLDLESRVGHGRIEQQICEIVELLIGFFRHLMPWIMMSYSSRNEMGLPVGMRGQNPPPVRLLKAIASYFSAEMSRGRLREVDAEIIARTLIGGAMQLVFGEVLAAGTSAPLPLPKEMFVRGMVDALLHGLSPRKASEKSSPSQMSRSTKRKTR